MNATIDGGKVDLVGANTAEEIGERLRQHLISMGIDPDSVYPVGCGEINDTQPQDHMIELTVTFRPVPKS